MTRKNVKLYIHMIGAGLVTAVAITPFALFFFPRTREYFFVLLFVSAACGLLSSLWGYFLANQSFGRLIDRIRREHGTVDLMPGDHRHVSTSAGSQHLDILEGSIERLLVELRSQADREAKREREMHLRTITSLVNALEARDDYTRDHSSRVAQFAMLLAERMSVPGEEIERIHLAAILHDIGKIGIRDSILLKPGKLSPEEWQVIRQHPDLGVQILAPVPGLEDVRMLVKHHHERVDGTGYPAGLAGEKIPLGSRIIAVADTFDAMIRARPYRGNVPFENVMAELWRVAGTQLWTPCVEAFQGVVTEIEEMEEFRREIHQEPGERSAA